MGSCTSLNAWGNSAQVIGREDGKPSFDKSGFEEVKGSAIHVNYFSFHGIESDNDVSCVI